MTLEEAIRLLDPKTSGEAIAEVEYYNGFSGKTAAIQAITDACEIAVEAMRKQIPNKPHKGMVFDTSTEIEACPICGDYPVGGMSFCENCGQALDWSDEE